MVSSCVFHVDPVRYVRRHLLICQSTADCEHAPMYVSLHYTCLISAFFLPSICLPSAFFSPSLRLLSACSLPSLRLPSACSLPYLCQLSAFLWPLFSLFVSGCHLLSLVASLWLPVRLHGRLALSFPSLSGELRGSQGRRFEHRST